MLRKIAPLALILGVCAAAEPEELIKYRQNTMKAIGGHMGAIAAIVQGKAGQPEHLLIHAKALDALSTTVKDLFPEESAHGETDAKQEIWDKHDDFVQAVQKLETAAPPFAQAVESGDQAKIGAALKELGGACKNCHDNFRKKKKQ
jgi:cytochrome c556